MKISVNDEPREFDPGTTIQQLIEILELDPANVVVQRNGDIVDRASFPTQAIAEGDRFDLIHFVGGG